MKRVAKYIGIPLAVFLVPGALVFAFIAAANVLYGVLYAAGLESFLGIQTAPIDLEFIGLAALVMGAAWVVGKLLEYGDVI